MTYGNFVLALLTPIPLHRHRRTAEGLTGEDKAYCFDLDGAEDPDDPPEDAYTVDSRNHGTSPSMPLNVEIDADSHVLSSRQLDAIYQVSMIVQPRLCRNVD